jgi:DNA-directed RNA polymerase subunit RPC12/RpoP
MAYYKCSYCEKFFTSKKKRSDHERKVHRANPTTEQQVIPTTERNISESERATEQWVTPATERNVSESEPAPQLKEHIARMHTDKQPQNEAAPEPRTKSTGRQLELQVKTKAKREVETETIVYYCVECGAALTKDQNPCPNCGTELDWSQVWG